MAGVLTYVSASCNWAVTLSSADRFSAAAGAAVTQDNAARAVKTTWWSFEAIILLDRRIQALCNVKCWRVMVLRFNVQNS